MDTPTPSMRSLALKCAVETCLPDGLPASTDAGSSHDHEITRRRHAESSNRALRPCESVSWKQSKVALLTFSKSVWTLAYLLLKAVASIVSWVHISLVQVSLNVLARVSFTYCARWPQLSSLCCEEQRRQLAINMHMPLPLRSTFVTRMLSGRCYCNRSQAACPHSQHPSWNMQHPSGRLRSSAQHMRHSAS